MGDSANDEDEKRKNTRVTRYMRYHAGENSEERGTERTLERECRKEGQGERVENFEETGKSTIVKAESSVARSELDHTDG